MFRAGFQEKCFQLCPRHIELIRLKHPLSPCSAIPFSVDCVKHFTVSRQIEQYGTLHRVMLIFVVELVLVVVCLVTHCHKLSPALGVDAGACGIRCRRCLAEDLRHMTRAEGRRAKRTDRAHWLSFGAEAVRYLTARIRSSLSARPVMYAI